MPRNAYPVRFPPAVAACLGLALLTVTGCGKAEPVRVAVHPVKGQVILAGKPAAGAVVVFHPKAPGAFPPPRAQADKDGNFLVTTFKTADGAPLGEYVITVELRSLVEKGGRIRCRSQPGARADTPNRAPASSWPAWSRARTRCRSRSFVNGAGLRSGI